MKTKLIIIILFLVFVCSCLRTPSDEELTMKLIPYNGKEIRIDGYYSVFDKNYNQYSNLIFYRNGILLSFSYSKKYEDIYNDQKIIDLIRNEKERWNLYQIINDTIAIQGWSLSDNYQYIVKNILIKITNDTTLNLRSVKNGTSILYHFNHFMLKPDSTNIFIK